MEGLREPLSSSPMSEQRAFIHSFVKEMKDTGKEVVLTYTIPLPPEGSLHGTAAVLDIVPLGGAERTRTANLLTASQALSH